MGHRSLNSAVLALAVAAAPATLAALAIAPTSAQAQPRATLDSSLVEMMPAGEVAADGSTPVTLRFFAMNPDGSAMSGMVGRAGVGGGVGGKLTEAQPGVYEAVLTPTAVPSAQTLTVNLKARTDAGPVEKTFSLRVVPSGARSIGITASPERMVLGSDSTATVTFQIDGAAATGDGDLSVLVSSGSLANLTPLGGGRYSGLYSAPDKLFPHNALFTVVDRRNPDKSFGAARLAMVGKANFPINTAPSARVILKVGKREFGPIQADASGKAQVPIVVPPGVREATVISILPDGTRTEDPLDLQIPATQRVKLFPTWAGVPADGNRSIKLRAFVVRQDGAADPNAAVVFTASRGAVGPVEHSGGGVYTADYTPPLADASGQTVIRARIDQPGEAQEDSLTLNLAQVRPTGLVLTPEPAVLDNSATQFQLFARVAGPDGNGVPGTGLRIETVGAQQQGETKDLGAGDYQATFSPDGNASELVVAARATPTGNPLRHIVVVPSDDVITSNGQDATALAVLTLDAFGHPVPGQKVQLSVSQGDAGVPASVTTDESGIGLVPLTSGTSAGAVRVQAKAGAHEGEGLVLQLPRVLARGPARDLPVSGTASLQAYQQGWDNLFESVVVARDGARAAVAGSINTAVGAPAKVALTADPAAVAPGGRVKFTIKVTDANNRPVAGQTLTVVSSGGGAPQVEEVGGGTYTALVDIPASMTGPAQITAVTSTGVASVFTLPVLPGAPMGYADAPAETAVADAAPAEEKAKKEKKEKPPKEAKEPREAGEFPFLRVGAGYTGGVYSYRQEPTVQGGPLYANAITVGGGVTDSQAGVAGVNVQARAWLPSLDALGADVRFRTVNWSINLPEGFEDPISDWLTNVDVNLLGRYSYDVDEGTRFYAAARLGFDTNDFLYFTQSAAAEDGAFEINYQQLIVPFNTSFGAEVGAEVGPLFGIAGYEAGFSDFSSLYSSEVDVELGYEIGSSAFIRAEFARFGRFTPLYDGGGQEVGQVVDTLTSFGLSGGFQM